jgi:PAS domain S-box-containing protein
MLAGIITAGWFYYSNYKAQYKDEIGQQLTAIGKLKADEIANWRRERLGDGKVLYKNYIFSALVKRYFNDPNDTGAREGIEQRLNNVQQAYQYDKLMLLDSLYRKKMIIPDSPDERSTSYVSWGTSDILGTGQIVFEDFYWNEQNHKIYLKVLIPIFEEGNSVKILGVVAMRIDPETYLYPFIANWPVPNIKTAETLLVRKKGESVEYLNELKFRKGTALKLEHSIANIQLPAVKAVLGHEGVVDGVDYQEHPVLADVRAVPDSPWFLVTKINASEMYAPLHKILLAVIAFITVLVGGAGAGFGVVWRQQRIRFYRQKYDEAKEWSTTFDSIPEMVSIVGRDFKIKMVNKTFADLFGKQPEEFFGERCYKLIHDLEGPCEECPLRKTLSNGKNAKLEVYYKPLRKHLEISTYPIFDDNGEIIEAVHFMRDITVRKLIEEGRKKASAQLRDSLRFNQEVILNAAVGVVVYDTQLRYLEWNTFMENMTGMKRKDVIGKDARELFPHIHESGADKAIERAFEGETVAMQDVAYRCPKTGKMGWVASTYTPHRNSAGQIIGAIGMIRDVTERKVAEGNLKNSETMFRSIATAVPVGLGMASERQIQWVNDYLLGLVGRQREEIVGKDTRIFYESDEGYNIVGNQFYRDLGEKGSAEIEVNWKHKDGKILNILLTGIALNKEDISSGIIFAALDITNRKQGEELLQKSEEQFRLLSEASFDPIIIHDKGVLINVNDQFCEMSGYERDELIGKNIISMAIAPEARESMMKQITSGDMETYESIGIRKDGTMFPIEIRVRNMEYEGRMVRVGAVRDITERKKAEEELHKTAVGN